jgi:hypothetical protein
VAVNWTSRRARSTVWLRKAYARGAAPRMRIDPVACRMKGGRHGRAYSFPLRCGPYPRTHGGVEVRCAFHYSRPLATGSFTELFKGAEPPALLTSRGECLGRPQGWLAARRVLAADNRLVRDNDQVRTNPQVGRRPA